MKWVALIVLLAAVTLLWGRFVLPAARVRYAEWARSLALGQVILYAATMVVLGISFGRFADQRIEEGNPAKLFFLAIVVGFLFRAYWAPLLWLGRTRGGAPSSA